MWIIHPDFFLSVVQKPHQQTGRPPAPHDVLTVRARYAGDLWAFRTLFCPELGRTVELARMVADYRFRADVRRDYLAQAMARIADALEYPSFKQACGRSEGGPSLAAIHRIWHELVRDAEARLPAERVDVLLTSEAGVDSYVGDVRELPERHPNLTYYEVSLPHGLLPPVVSRLAGPSVVVQLAAAVAADPAHVLDLPPGTSFAAAPADVPRAIALVLAYRSLNVDPVRVWDA